MKKRKITEIERIDQDTYRRSDKLPLSIVLDNVRSMNNVGSVFRTADAFRLEAIHLCGITARPPHPDIRKTALGAEQSVDWQYHDTTISAIEALLSEGYEVYALEQAYASTELQDFVPKLGVKYALVLGNEVRGVGQNVIDACTGCIEIPQFGTKHSLNVSVASGIAIWQIVRPLLHLL